MLRLRTDVYFRRANSCPFFRQFPTPRRGSYSLPLSSILDLLSSPPAEPMPHLRVTDLTDPRLAPYREMKDRDLARHGPLFIAEGWQVVRRLLASNFTCESILTSTKRANEVASIASPDVTVYVAEAEVLDQVIGFKFHQGVLACGRRKPPPTLAE